MKMTILGSGSWEGVPALGCKCIICREAQTNSAKTRTRPCLLITDDQDKGQLLFECSPDIRIQSKDIDKVETVFISHYHYDHAGGLPEFDAYVDLRLKKQLDVYCSLATAGYLSKTFGYLPITYKTLKPQGSLNIAEYEIIPFPVYHMHSHDNSNGLPNPAAVGAFGFIVLKDGKKVVYMGDFYKVDENIAELIKDADILITDGTYLFEEYYKSEYSQLIRDEHDPDHLHNKDIIKFAEGTGAKKVIYHSISHLPELSQEQMQKLLPEDHFVSYDGMQVTV